jgi:hypothetical protein
MVRLFVAPAAIADEPVKANCVAVPVELIAVTGELVTGVNPVSGDAVSFAVNE